MQGVAAVEVAGPGHVGIVVGRPIGVGPLHDRRRHVFEDRVGAVRRVGPRGAGVDRDVRVLGGSVVVEGEVLGKDLGHEHIGVGGGVVLGRGHVAQERHPHLGAGQPVDGQPVLVLERHHGRLGDHVRLSLDPQGGQRGGAGPAPGEGPVLRLRLVNGRRRAPGRAEAEGEVVELGQQLLEPEDVAVGDGETERRGGAQGTPVLRPQARGPSGDGHHLLRGRDERCGEVVAQGRRVGGPTFRPPPGRWSGSRPQGDGRGERDLYVGVRRCRVRP